MANRIRSTTDPNPRPKNAPASTTLTPNLGAVTPPSTFSQKNRGVFTNAATGLQTNAQGIPLDPNYSYSGQTGTFVDNRNGQMVQAATSGPISSNQNYSQVVPKPGLSQNFAQSNGGYSMSALGLNGPGTAGDRTSAPSGLFSSGLLGTVGNGSTTSAGVTGASASTPTGSTPASTNPYASLVSSPTLGGVTSMPQGSPQSTTSLGLQSLGGTLTPEQIAQEKYNATVQGANQDASLAQQNYLGTVGLATQQTQQNLGLLGGEANTAFGQAQRNETQSLAANQIDQAKADLQYTQAVQQVQQNRDTENQYLMQKLAGAGALDSTAGVQILGKSAQNYDQMFANLYGQRQIALSQFAQADSSVRNQFATTIENVTNKVMELQTQLMQGLQSTILGAGQTRAGALGQASKDQQTAYSDFLGNLYDIQVAKQQAQSDALAAAQKAQQQAFDNAISLAGLTGTFTDPLTGKEVRTLNGLKYDDSLKPKGGSGGVTPGVYTALLQQAAQLGVIDQSQFTGLAGETNKTAIEQYSALLQSQIASASVNPLNVLQGFPKAVLGGISELAGVPYNPTGGFPYSAGSVSQTTTTGTNGSGDVNETSTTTKF